MGSFACPTARNSQNSLARDTVVHDAMQRGMSFRGSGNVISSGGDTARGRGVCDPGGAKPLSTSTRCKVWRPAEGVSALLQQASASLHDEVGRVQSSSLRISQDVEIGLGCVVTVSRLPTPDLATSPHLDMVVRSGEVFPGCLPG